MAVAYCWASGLIQFGYSVPEGALPIARGRMRDIKNQLCARARHAYDGSLLVPGVPEAEDQDEGLEALEAFVAWIGGKA